MITRGDSHTTEDGAGWLCAAGRELFFIDLAGTAKRIYSQPAGHLPLWAKESPDRKRLAIMTNTSDQNFWELKNF